MRRFLAVPTLARLALLALTGFSLLQLGGMKPPSKAAGGRHPAGGKDPAPAEHVQVGFWHGAGARAGIAGLLLVVSLCWPLIRPARSGQSFDMRGAAASPWTLRAAGGPVDLAALVGRLPRIRAFRARFGLGGVALLALIALIGIFALERAVGGKFPWDKTILNRMEKGQALVLKDYVIIGVWWGSLITSVICAVLLAGAKWWLPGGRLAPRLSDEAPPRPARWMLVALVLIVAAGAWLRAPLLSQGLWNDEEFAMRRFTHGQWMEAAPEKWRFEPVTWTTTLFANHTGNNHLLSSAVNRLALDAWRWMTGAPREAFSEAALRAPSLIAGLLTLVLVAWLGFEMKSPWAALGAAALLAVHPWHIRYSVEARGYSPLIFFLCLCVLGLVIALRTNRLLPWLLFAIGEAGALLSFGGALYPVAAINLVAAALILVRREPRRLGTWAGFNLLGAVPVLVWMTPSVPQILGHLKLVEDSVLAIGAGWLRSYWELLRTGVDLGPQAMGAQAGLSPLLFAAVVFCLLPALALAGLIASCFRGPAGRLAIGAIALGGVAGYAHNTFTRNPMVLWYLVFMLVPFVLAVALGVVALLRRRAAWQAAGILVVVAAYAFVTRDFRALMGRIERQPMRQTVSVIRDEHPGAVTATTGVSGFNTRSYDPRVRVLETPAHLDLAVAEAHSKNQPLFIYFCGTEPSRQRYPEVMARVLDSGEFRHVRDVESLDPIFEYHIYEASKPEGRGRF